MKSYLIVTKTTKDNVDQSTENTALPDPRRNEEDKTITGVTIKNKKSKFLPVSVSWQVSGFFPG